MSRPGIIASIRIVSRPECRGEFVLDCSRRDFDSHGNFGTILSTSARSRAAAYGNTGSLFIPGPANGSSNRLDSAAVTIVALLRVYSIYLPVRVYIFPPRKILFRRKVVSRLISRSRVAPREIYTFESCCIGL